MIPSTSIVYAQVVECSDIEKWNSLPENLNVAGVNVKFPSVVSSCPGVPSCQDLQLDAIQRQEFTVLSPPIPIFKFEFTNPSPIPKHRESVIKFKSDSKGVANTVFLWWDLEMDTSGNNVLSCQPSYVSQGPSSWFKECVSQTPAWRDHWMHSAYYIPRRCVLEEDGVLYSAHDEYSFWFDVGSSDGIEFPRLHPVCRCGVHNVLSRYQVYMMNDRCRYETFLRTFQRKIVRGQTVCVCLSDCSVLPVLLARSGARKVFVVERCRENVNVTKRIVEENSVGDIVTVMVKDVEEITEQEFDGLKVSGR